MKMFLNLKHWQIFSLWILGTIQAVFLMHSFLWPISFAIFFMLVFGWVYSIGKVLNEKNRTITRKLNIWSVILLISFIPYWMWALQMHSDAPERQNGIIVFTSLVLSSIANINIAIIAAKSIKEKEKQHSQNFSDYFIEFILILYLFIGVWALQNRLNKLVKEK